MRNKVVKRHNEQGKITYLLEGDRPVGLQEAVVFKSIETGEASREAASVLAGTFSLPAKEKNKYQWLKNKGLFFLELMEDAGYFSIAVM